MTYGRMARGRSWLVLLVLLALAAAPRASAEPKPGDRFSASNLAEIEKMISPASRGASSTACRSRSSNAVHQAPPGLAATEKYSSQVNSPRTARLENYVAGMPFPRSTNDPQVAEDHVELRVQVPHHRRRDLRNFDADTVTINSGKGADRRAPPSSITCAP
jgi:hypothetical protein